MLFDLFYELTLFVCVWRWSCILYMGADDATGDAADAWDEERG